MKNTPPAKQYEFTFQVVERSDDYYYVTRWDLATPLTVVASNLKEADAEVWRVLGKSTRPRRHWVRSDRPDSVRPLDADQMTAWAILASAVAEVE